MPLFNVIMNSILRIKSEKEAELGGGEVWWEKQKNKKTEQVKKEVGRGENKKGRREKQIKRNRKSE